MLEELDNDFRHEKHSLAKKNTIGKFTRDSIDKLSKMSRGVVIYETFATNNAGMDLYAMLAELDGVGVRRAYLFLEKKAQPCLQ